MKDDDGIWLDIVEYAAYQKKIDIDREAIY